MRRSTLAVAAMFAALGCGKKDEPSVIGAMADAAAAAPKLETAMATSESFRKERVAKGDTVAIPYTELKGFLPTSLDGYTAQGGASGSQQSMGAFSMSQASQTWERTGGDGNTPAIEITLVDFGGTEQGYAMMAAPLLMNYSQEDDHHRIGSVPIDVPHASGWAEYNKDDHDTKVTVVARYRFLITVEARGQSDDQSATVKAVAEEIARKFDGK